MAVQVRVAPNFPNFEHDCLLGFDILFQLAVLFYRPYPTTFGTFASMGHLSTKIKQSAPECHIAGESSHSAADISVYLQKRLTYKLDLSTLLEVYFRY